MTTHMAGVLLLKKFGLAMRTEIPLPTPEDLRRFSSLSVRICGKQLQYPLLSAQSVRIRGKQFRVATARRARHPGRDRGVVVRLVRPACPASVADSPRVCGPSRARGSHA